MSSASKPIRIRGLKKSFGSQVVLANIDLDLPSAQNVALLGISGSGKSVLMKCILGLVPPDSGSIQIDGCETVGLRPAEHFSLMRKIGVLFQNGALFDSLPIWQNISFSRLNSGDIGKTVARTLAIEALAQVGLGADVADLFPAELSGGMQKRVALARSLFGDPQILFLDNPSAGLDPILTAIVDSLIAASLNRLRAIAMTITHDLKSVQRVAQRAAFLADGQIAWEGPVAMLSTCRQPQVQEFLRAGRPQAGDDLSTTARGFLRH